MHIPLLQIERMNIRNIDNIVPPTLVNAYEDTKVTDETEGCIHDKLYLGKKTFVRKTERRY